MEFPVDNLKRPKVQGEFTEFPSAVVFPSHANRLSLTISGPHAPGRHLVKFAAAILLLTLYSLTALADLPLEISVDKSGTARIPAVGSLVSENGVLIPLKTPTPPVVGFDWLTSPAGSRKRPALIFNSDATKAYLEFDTASVIPENETLVVDIGRETGQQPDGRILFLAADANVVGTNAKLETHPGNDRIGFWSNLDDRVTWEYQTTRPGTYAVDVMYSLNGTGESDIVVSFGEQTLEHAISGTGSWYRYQIATLGTIKLASGEKSTLSVKGIKTDAGAVMNLKSIILRPAPEGDPIAQSKSGEVLCHSRDVTIHGVKVQYEPKPEKNTVGYWVNAEDWVSWDFTVDKPGRFNVEVLQGCGKGHGGSEVAVWVGSQKLEFTVEDTGHFQNFKPRVIGTVEIAAPGVSTLKIIPINKKSVAVMDVRQVRLIPVNSP